MSHLLRQIVLPNTAWFSTLQIALSSSVVFGVKHVGIHQRTYKAPDITDAMFFECETLILSNITPKFMCNQLKPEAFPKVRNIFIVGPLCCSIPISLFSNVNFYLDHPQYVNLKKDSTHIFALTGEEQKLIIDTGNCMARQSEC